MSVISDYLEDQAELANKRIANMAENKNKELLQHELSHIHTYNTAYEDATDDFIRILKEVINLAVTAEKLMTAGEVLDLIINLVAENDNTQYQAHHELVETYTKKLGSI